MPVPVPILSMQMSMHINACSHVHIQGPKYTMYENAGCRIFTPGAFLPVYPKYLCHVFAVSPSLSPCVPLVGSPARLSRCSVLHVLSCASVLPRILFRFVSRVLFLEPLVLLPCVSLLACYARLHGSGLAPSPPPRLRPAHLLAGVTGCICRRTS